MKKLITYVLVVLLICSLVLPAYADEEEPPVQGEEIEEYVNIRTATIYLNIATNGTTTVNITCVGLTGTTHISSRTYLEKWNGSSWSRVSFNGASEIVDGVSAISMTRTYTTTVGSGQYRATTIFTVTRGTDETITVYSSTVTH